MNNEMYKNLLKNAPFAYSYNKVVFNEKGKAHNIITLDINPAFEKMTGFKKEQVIGKYITEVIPNLINDKFNWIDCYGSLALTGEKLELVQFSDSLDRWFKISCWSPAIGYFITFFNDITLEIKNIKNFENQKKELRKLTDDLEIIFSSTHDAMFLLKVDQGEFRYIRNNTAHQNLTGISQEEIKDKTPVELVGKELGESICKNYQRCLSAGEIIKYEETLSILGIEKTWITSLTPVFDNDNVRYIIGSSKDITLLKEIREERDLLLARLADMFNKHIAAMLIINPSDGKIIDVNPAACEFYGYSKSEFLKLQIEDINMLPKDEVKRLYIMAKEEKKKHFVFPHRLKGGQIKLVDVYSSPISIGGRSELFSIIFDVTDREKYKKDLHFEKELLNTTLASIGDGVVTTDLQGKIRSMNKVAETITGWNQNEVKGKLFSEVFVLLNEDSREAVENPIEKVLNTAKITGLANHTILINKNKNEIPIADSAAPIKDSEGKVFGVVMVFRDVSADKEYQDQITYFSYHDSLTGLFNRRYVEEKIEAFTYSGTPMTIIMGDVNGLKLFNDVFGHGEGDNLLRKASEIISTCCRKKDIVSRYGGDEFLILLPNTSLAAANKIIRRIKDKCSSYKKDNLLLSIALGCAEKTKLKNDLQLVLKEAEENMYRQKLIEGNSFRYNIINTLLSALEIKSLETEKHAERLKEISHSISKKMGLTVKEMDELTLLAMLHDIGKIGINEYILKKSESLNLEEWEEIKKHPEIGYRIAKNTPELASVAELILAHHERWDGQGYPRGLKGEEIPLLCRIIAVADAYDAMTSDRVYRKAMKKEEAIVELIRNAGTQFDPRVVDTFIEIVN